MNKGYISSGINCDVVVSFIVDEGFIEALFCDRFSSHCRDKRVVCCGLVWKFASSVRVVC